MTQRTLRRFVTAGACAALLSMGAATPAQARSLGTLDRAWQFFQGLLSWSAPVAKPATTQKQGLGLDPNGSPNSATNAQPSCVSCNDQGLGLDPNG
jgi:hypothetical protein